MDAADAVARLGGVARTDQVLTHCTYRQLAAAVADGSVLRLGRGRYGLPAADRTHVAAQRLHGTISHLSAAVEHGWEVLVPPVRPWVAVARNRTLPLHQRRGVQVVWSEVEGTVTSPLRTTLDCARALPFREALAVADSALRSGSVEPDELRHAAEETRGGGSRQVRRVAAEATALAANPFESALRAIALDVPGLGVVPQAPIELAGFTIHPDLVDRRLRIVVEAEGWVHHAGREAFASDLERYTRLLVEGWTPARFGHHAVVFDAGGVRRTLESLVRTGTMRLRCRTCA